MMETFMFASINEKNGSLLCSRTILMYGVAGIAVAELAGLGRIKSEGKRISVVNASSTGDAMLDEVLGILVKKGSFYKLHSIISSLPYKVNRFGKRLLEKLEDNGQIRIEQSRFLGLIPYNHYIITRVSEHSRLVMELKGIILKGDKKSEAQQALLITILHTCYVLQRLFDKDERKQVKETLKKVGKGEFFDTLDGFDRDVQKAVKAVIAATHAAAT